MAAVVAAVEVRDPRGAGATSSTRRTSVSCCASSILGSDAGRAARLLVGADVAVRSCSRSLIIVVGGLVDPPPAADARDRASRFWLTFAAGIAVIAASGHA